MPPKRKRAGADTAEASTPSTRKSTRTIRGKGAGAEKTDVSVPDNSADGVEGSTPPPLKKTRGKGTKATASKSEASGSTGRETKAMQASTIDDQPLNSTTSPRQNDDGLEEVKQAPSKSSAREEYTLSRAQVLFESFADDDDPNVIGPGGVERLCMEAKISLNSAQPLILAWQFKASEMAKFTRKEWLQGTETLRISSLPVLAIALKELDDLVIYDKEPITRAPSLSSSVKKRSGVGASQDPYNRSRYWEYASDREAAFSELYQFCFALSKPPQSRNLDIETATALWSVLLAPRHPIITNLVEFLNEKGTYKGANKDIWNMVHEFCRVINTNLDNYETDGAWPTMLDDFVTWKRNKIPISTGTVLTPIIND